VSEAHWIRLAHLFDPVLAVHTSLVEPSPAPDPWEPPRPLPMRVVQAGAALRSDQRQLPLRESAPHAGGGNPREPNRPLAGENGGVLAHGLHRVP
jgi:hypothetical protein